mgnify:FL=1
MSRDQVLEELLGELAAAHGARAACASRDDGGHTLAHWAAKRGDAVILEWALARGADPGAPSADDVGMQPLHWACTEGRLACARLLVDRGADRGRKRVRNSQLQRLISRPFSTRFG